MIDAMIRNMPYTFIPIFVAIDIFAVIPIFLSMTEGMQKNKIRAIERDSVITALVVGLTFVAIGEAIFRVLGITSDDFKIAGGLILLIFAILEIMGYSRMREQLSGKLGVVPIGVPLIVGPAVLTTLLMLVDQYGIASTVIALVTNLIAVYIALRVSGKMMRFFGKGGIAAVSKIMALLLASIAVMMIRSGMENIIARVVAGP